MATMTQNGISFYNVKTAGVRTDTWPIYLGGNQQGPDEDGGVINAVDIDWNGAVVGDGQTINSTGELLSWISSKGEQGP